MGYKMNTRVANRQPRDNDEAQFQQLIQNKFQTVNWFSFKPDDAPGRNQFLVLITKTVTQN